MIDVDYNLTYKGQPIEVLQRLMAERSRVLGECARDAVIATGILLLKSLRADAKVARKSPRKAQYSVEEIAKTGWMSDPGGVRPRRVGRYGSARGLRVLGIHAVNLLFGHRGDGQTYRVRLANPNVPFRTTKNPDCYYVLAKSRADAERWARARMARLLRKERGMAKSALGLAMAQISTHAPAMAVEGGRPRDLVRQAVSIATSGGKDAFTLKVSDDLNFAMAAQKSGPAGFALAVKKASNSIAGRLRKVWGHELDAALATPFPEVSVKRR